MQTKVMKFSEFKDNLRDKVLSALDALAAEVMESDKVIGAKDCELPSLFAGIDVHAKMLADRINAGNEVNSAFVRIDMAA